MIDLARKIGLSESLINKIDNLYRDKKLEIEAFGEKCMTDSFKCLGKKDPQFRLAVILFLAVKVKEKYDAAGINEKIYYDTMSDIKIWSEKNGEKGLKNYGWLKNHVNFELFRIGRLQFQLYECKNRTLNYKKLPFSYGDKLIYVHIPEGEKLCKEKCISSLEAANKYFSTFFPDYRYKYYFCESWLLFDGNNEFMAEGSNIREFMTLFEHCYSIKIDEQAIERIFGKRRLLKKSYPESTDLQRRAKAYMLDGKRMGIGVGVIKKDKFGI